MPQPCQGQAAAPSCPQVSFGRLEQSRNFARGSGQRNLDPTYQARRSPLLKDMHLITPGIAASLTPTSLEPARAASRRRPRGRLHLPHLRFHLPHLHLPQRHA
jgi:hypothetical protein